MIELEPRVLQISFSELPTLQKHLYLSFAELRRQGVDTWTVGSANLAIDIDLDDRNLLVATPPTPKPGIASLRQASGAIRDLSRRIAQIRPDIVHFTNKHTWNFLLLRRLRRDLPNAAFLHTFHDPIGHEGDSVQKGVVLYHRVVQRMLDGIVVFSDIAKRQTEEVLKPRCPVYQVPFGEKPWKEYEPIEQLTHRVLAFGRLNSYKGVKYYPEIAERLLELSPETTFVIAGKPSDDIDRSILDRLSEMPNVELHARFIEESEVDGFFKNCDLVLMPYTSITQSGVILDAYSRSRCVVAFDIEGMSSYVPEDRLLVSPFQMNDYAGLVSNLVSNMDELNRASKECWEFGRDHFSLSLMGTGLLDVYRACYLNAESY